MREFGALSFQRRQAAESPATSHTGGNGSRVAALERLALLHDRGALTDAEFAAEKAGLVDDS
jgi:hypothetical protein